MAGYAPASLPSLSLVFFAPANSVGAPAPLPALSLILQATNGRTLTSGAGSFALTGVSTTALKAALKVVSAAGSYALTGQAATLTKATPGYGVDAPAPLPHMSLVLSRPATDPLMAGQSGLFTVTGVAAALTRGHGIVADVAAFVFSGAPALRDIQITADVGAFTWTRNAASLTRVQNGFSAAKGTFVMTGKPAGLVYQQPTQSQTLAAGVGEFALTGQDATLPATLQRVLIADTGTFTIARHSADLHAVRWGGVAPDDGTWTDITRSTTNWN